MTAHFPRLALLLGTAALLAAAPVGLRFDPASGAFALEPAMALASGRDDDRPGHDDNDDHGGDRDDDRDGRDDDSDDRDDDRNDDDRNDNDNDDGPGHDLNDDDNDDGPGHDLNDDSDDSDDSVSKGPTKGKPLAAAAGGRKVAKIEHSRRGIEVTYRNGAKEQIEGRWYERKDKTGRTVEQRLATQADIDRLNALR